MAKEKWMIKNYKADFKELAKRHGIGDFCPIFSRIRSKITIVALMEYPTKVNIHAINVFPTEIFVTAYTTLNEKDELQNGFVNDYGVDAQKITTQNISATVSGEMKEE